MGAYTWFKPSSSVKLTAIMLAASASVALAQAPTITPPAAAPPQASIASAADASGCVKPAAPRYPREGQQLTLEQLDWTRDQRDRFLAASNTYLGCLNKEIEDRMRAMMTNNYDDPRVNAAGIEHQAGSAAAGEAIKRFALLCYDYEGRSGPYASGCVPGVPR